MSINTKREVHDLEAVNSGSEVEFFLVKKISLFGCNVARAFSRSCSLDLIFVHIWGGDFDIFIKKKFTFPTPGTK